MAKGDTKPVTIKGPEDQKTDAMNVEQKEKPRQKGST